MENEFKLSVGITRANYNWEVNSVPELQVNFQIMNLDPRIDPVEAGDYLSRALEKYLTEKNESIKPLTY